MIPFNPIEHPHRRLNALTGEWLLVSPHRTLRPWQGQVERIPQDERPSYDPGCYLCPGNSRAGGVRNPVYENTFVFTNDFSALLPDMPPAPAEDDPLFQTRSVSGTCRVVCFSPRHDLTLAEMQPGEIRQVINVWAEQAHELGQTYRWVQVFENKGAIMGCSNPHPHGQIWALDELPNEVFKEDRQQRAYTARTGRRLLIDYAQEEIERNQRVVLQNQDWLALVPYWAVWPFETLVLPLHPVQRLEDLAGAPRDSLAELLKGLLVRYDNLFETSFPYSMGWHYAPYTAEDPTPWQLHAHFYPPLLRSASVKKFMVGFELLGEAQRDLTPEHAAARLRELTDIHYRSIE